MKIEFTKKITVNINFEFSYEEALLVRDMINLGAGQLSENREGEERHKIKYLAESILDSFHTMLLTKK